MKKYLILLGVILEYPLCLIARQISPTDMAGLGLDILAMAIVFFYDVYVAWESIRDLRRGVLPTLSLIALVISGYLIYHWVTSPQSH